MPPQRKKCLRVCAQNSPSRKIRLGLFFSKNSAAEPLFRITVSRHLIQNSQKSHSLSAAPHATTLDTFALHLLVLHFAAANLTWLAAGRFATGLSRASAATCGAARSTAARVAAARIAGTATTDTTTRVTAAAADTTAVPA